jgi:glucose/mannose-6-phosphate isomerase
MLDDLKYIHQRDGNDALGVVEKQWQQLGHNFELTPLSAGFDNIVYAGMGGSALAALLSRSWPGYKVPFFVCRNYDLPPFANEKTLVITASYSGNTEETLEALSQAEERHAQIAVIDGGGKLGERAVQKGYPRAVLPKVEQPRYAVIYNLKAIVDLLRASDVLGIENAEAEMQTTADFLQKAVEPWLPTVPMAKNPAKQLAVEVVGKSQVIYAGPLFGPVAFKWKINFNENAKNVAWWNEYPEFNHNEFIGWSSHPIEKPYAVIDLRSNLEHKRVQKRFEVSERMLSGLRPAPHVVQAQGESLLQQLLWTMAYGDFVTIYAALLNGVNPAPVDLVEKFKAELSK